MKRAQDLKIIVGISILAIIVTVIIVKIFFDSPDPNIPSSLEELQKPYQKIEKRIESH